MFKWLRKRQAKKLQKSTSHKLREKCIICGRPIFIGQYVAMQSQRGWYTQDSTKTR